jgi:hypothetical protein
MEKSISKDPLQEVAMNDEIVFEKIDSFVLENGMSMMTGSMGR